MPEELVVLPQLAVFPDGSNDANSWLAHSLNSLKSSDDGYFAGDRGVGVVVFERHVLELEVVDAFNRGVELYGREGAGLAF